MWPHGWRKAYQFSFHSTIIWGFRHDSDSKESTWNAGDPGINPWVKKIPWRREWQPTAVFLPGEFHGQRSLVGCNPLGHKESDTTEWLSPQVVKNPPIVQETRVPSLNLKDPSQKEIAAHSSGYSSENSSGILLPGEFHGQRSLEGYSPWGHKESDMT